MKAVLRLYEGGIKECMTSLSESHIPHHGPGQEYSKSLKRLPSDGPEAFSSVGPFSSFLSSEGGLKGL